MYDSIMFIKSNNLRRNIDKCGHSKANFGSNETTVDVMRQTYQNVQMWNQ